jgi:hypothetical protein
VLNTQIKRSPLSRHAIFAISSHDASRVAVYRTPNYERNHSEGAAAQKDVTHDGQHDRQASIQAIIGSEVIPPVKPELFCERKELGICNRSAAFRHHRSDFCLADLRSRRCAEPISAAHRKLSASTTIWAIAEQTDNAATITQQRNCRQLPTPKRLDWPRRSRKEHSPLSFKWHTMLP